MLRPSPNHWTQRLPNDDDDDDDDDKRWTVFDWLNPHSFETKSAFDCIENVV